MADIGAMPEVHGPLLKVVEKSRFPIDVSPTKMIATSCAVRAGRLTVLEEQSTTYMTVGRMRRRLSLKRL